MRRLAAVLALAIFALTIGSPSAKAAGAASGTIHVMNSGASLVLVKMQTECNATPQTQGIDGYVFTINPTSTTRISVSGTPAVPGTPVDLDVYFIDAACRVIGDSWYGAFVNSVAVPAATKYVLVDLTLGAEVTFRATWT